MSRLNPSEQVREDTERLFHAQSANNLFAEHAAKSQLHVDLIHLLKRADALGLVVTVNLQPLQPLAMGNYKPMVEIRKKMIR